MKPLLIALCVLTVLSNLGRCEDEPRSHRLVLEDVNDLHDLFRYDGHTMPLVSAHRGGALPRYPENCIATFENTLRHTFSILEIDLQYTKDGHIVLHHDATLERTTTGSGRVGDMTLKELKNLQLLLLILEQEVIQSF